MIESISPIRICLISICSFTAGKKGPATVPAKIIFPKSAKIFDNFFRLLSVKRIIHPIYFGILGKTGIKKILKSLSG